MKETYLLERYSSSNLCVHYFGYIQIMCILFSTLFTIQEVVESLIYGTPTVIFEQ
jgi:hypothetical protein